MSLDRSDAASHDAFRGGGSFERARGYGVRSARPAAVVTVTRSTGENPAFAPAIRPAARDRHRAASAQVRPIPPRGRGPNATAVTPRRDARRRGTAALDDAHPSAARARRHEPRRVRVSAAGGRARRPPGRHVRESRGSSCARSVPHLLRLGHDLRERMSRADEAEGRMGSLARSEACTAPPALRAVLDDIARRGAGDLA